MLLNFVAAADGTRLSKTFVMQDGQIEVHPYPNVADFTSYTHTPKNIDEAYAALQMHAEEGNALLKGALARPLVNERRAGATNPTQPTDYLVLDLDFDSGFNSIEDFLGAMGLGDVSYVLHHSSSSGIRADTGLRAHIFIWLDKPYAPDVLKSWLKAKNLDITGLSSQLELTASGFGLKWPLDITTCQNDKLIYIADPVCDGVDDPMQGHRFELVHKSKDRAVIDMSGVNVASIDAKTEDKVAELRKAAGLPKREARYKAMPGGEQVLQNPSRAAVTGERRQRGFVYLNLNNGDSWAYYYPEGRPDLLFNFKGEPIVRLKDVAPDYYRQVVEAAAPAKKEQPGGQRRYAMRDARADTYYSAVYDASKDEVTVVPVSSRSNLRDFLGVAGIEMPDIVPEWNIEFDPRETKVIDEQKQWVNLYKPTQYLRAEYLAPRPVPKNIDRILTSICVDETTKQQFLNWLAYIFQTRKKAKTAWVFHGVEGTGKGLLFEKILSPLFGHDYCREVTIGQFEEKYNDFLEQSLFVMVDEVKVRNDEHGSAVMDKLRNVITEDNIEIRAMRRGAAKRRSFVNLILATNHPDPIKLTAGDRRYNVAPAQEHRLFLTEEEVDAIDGELFDFAACLAHFQVDEAAIRTPLGNESKELMMRAAESTAERIFRALREGDLDFFLDQLREDPVARANIAYSSYEKAVRRWAANLGDDTHVSQEQVCDVYAYLTGKPINNITLGRIAAGSRVNFRRMRAFDNKMGISVQFRTEHPELVKKLTEPNIHELKARA